MKADKTKQHVCKTCGDTFTEYSYEYTCGVCCGDGYNDDGDRCFQCGGDGELTSIVKRECPGCLEIALDEDW